VEERASWNKREILNVVKKKIRSGDLYARFGRKRKSRSTSVGDPLEVRHWSLPDRRANGERTGITPYQTMKVGTSASREGCREKVANLTQAPGKKRRETILKKNRITISGRGGSLVVSSCVN